MANIMTIRAPDEIQNRLLYVAKELGLTRNALVLVILNNWLEENYQVQNDSNKRKKCRKYDTN